LRNDRVFRPSPPITSENYLKALPRMLAGRIRLLDHPGARSQFAMLERKPMAGGDHVDHPRSASAHDDVACAIAGAICQVMDAVQEQAIPMTGPLIIKGDGSLVGLGPVDPRLPANYRTFSGTEPWRQYVGADGSISGGSWWSGLPGFSRDRRNFR
jgi:hypothetical protein